ncbi:MAG TPA: hypothetical protein VF828_05150 [Patescibacteria group bacterium]
MKNFSTKRILWTATALLALTAATVGVLRPEIYKPVMRADLLPGTIAQDWLTIFVAAGLLGLIATTKKGETKKQIIILGVLGSFGYLYAIYAIERIYNILYLAYLAILSLCLYGIPYSISGLKDKEKWEIPRGMKIISIIFSVLIAVIFIIIWVGSLLPAMRTGQKIELYYSIYILDLCWIMPGFLITAYLTWKNKNAGILLTPAMYILGIFVIFPLGLGEITKQLDGLTNDIKSMMMSFILSGLFMVMAAAQLSLLRKKKI